jgi:FkbM family methyltransferase
MKKIIKRILNRYEYDIVTLYLKGSGRYKIDGGENNCNLYDTPTGKYLLPNFLKKDIISNTMQRGEVFDAPIVELAKRYVKPNTAFLDVGANYGQMSVIIAKHLESIGGGKVYAFEAEPFVGSILKRNLELNQCANARAVLGAVYNRSGEEVVFPEPDFKQFDAYGSYGLDPSQKAGRSVKTLTIDSLNIPEPVSFLKIDIQGSDLFGMQGAEEMILKHKPVIVFEFEQQFQDQFGTSFNDYLSFVEHIGYKFVEIIADINYVIAPKNRLF